MGLKRGVSVKRLSPLLALAVLSCAQPKSLTPLDQESLATRRLSALGPGAKVPQVRPPNPVSGEARRGMKPPVDSNGGPEFEPPTVIEEVKSNLPPSHLKMKKEDILARLQSFGDEAVTVNISFAENLKPVWSKGRGRNKVSFPGNQGTSFSLEASDEYEATHGFALLPTHHEVLSEDPAALREARAFYDRLLPGYRPLENDATLNFAPGDAIKHLDLLFRLHEASEVVDLNMGPTYLPVASANYTAPPYDGGFPSPDWILNDIVNTQTTENYQSNATGQNLGTYWFNRHSVGKAWANHSATGVNQKVAVIDFMFSVNLNNEITYDLTQARKYSVSGTTFTSGVGSMGNDLPLDLTNPTSIVNFEHGTTCSSLVAGKRFSGASPNPRSLCGVAPDATIVPIRHTGGSKDSIIACLNYAATTTAGVVLLESDLSIWSTPDANGKVSFENDDGIRNAINACTNAGKTVVIPAGNFSKRLDIVSDPNKRTKAIVVGGIDQFNNLYYVQEAEGFGNGSNFGDRVDLAASAVKVGAMKNYEQNALISWFVAERTANYTGTSFSGPMVAGAAALMRQYETNPDRIRSMLLNTADVAAPVVGALWDRNSNTITNYGTYKGDRHMDGGNHGSEGWGKVRILNADAAVGVAKNRNQSGHRYQLFASASQDYTQIKRALPTPVLTWEGWLPVNPSATHSTASGTGNFEFHTYVAGGFWTGAHTVFDQGLAVRSKISGAPALRTPSNQFVTGAWTTTGSFNGWTNHSYYTLSTSGVTP